MLGAKATAQDKAKKEANDPLYTILLPNTSDNGPATKGPKPSPITYRLIPRIVTSLLTWNWDAMGPSVNEAY